jgi:hypothetical protein
MRAIWPLGGVFPRGTVRGANCRVAVGSLTPALEASEGAAATAAPAPLPAVALDTFALDLVATCDGG